jgi:GTP pyrophosphokinase
MKKIKVTSMKSRTDHKRQLVYMDFDLELTSVEVLTRVCKRIEQTKDVLSVKRLG